MALSSSTEHVIIIGGGATSALIAVRLAERGFRVTVLEKAQLGNGSSSRSAAGIRAQFSTEETVVGMQYSEWWYSHFHDLLHSPTDTRQQPVSLRSPRRNPRMAAPQTTRGSTNLAPCTNGSKHAATSWASC